MTMIGQIETAPDGIMAALLAGLEIEFGRGAGEALAARFLAAEEVDFRWNARVRERWLGTYDASDDDEFMLDRVAICGAIGGEWFMATMLIDGDGAACGMLGCRTFTSATMAHQALLAAR